MTICRFVRGSRTRFHVVTVFVLAIFAAFTLLLPHEAHARLTSPGKGGECEWMMKFEDFVSYEASREFLATIGETPRSFLDMARVLDANQRAQLWEVVAPAHPASVAVELFVAGGYDRTTAETLVAELTREEVNAMISYDQLEGGWPGGGLWAGLGTALVILAVVVLVALVVYLVYEEQKREDRGGTSLDHLPEASTATIGDHLRHLRSSMGLERSEKPTF